MQLGVGLLLWATGSSLRLLRGWRSLLGILPHFTYYCSDNARSALETGRPATSGNRLSIPNGQVVPRWSAGGAVQHRWRFACDSRVTHV